jgi:hypothetical protein
MSEEYKSRADGTQCRAPPRDYKTFFKGQVPTSSVDGFYKARSHVTQKLSGIKQWDYLRVTF